MTAPTRVLFVCQPTSGGVAVHIEQLVAAAHRANYAVSVVAPDSDGLGMTVSSLGATWIPMGLKRHLDIRDIRYVLELRRLIIATDVVHLHSSKAGFVGRLALLTLPPRSRPRSLFTPHGWSWLVGGRAGRLYARLERLFAHVTDRIVVVSDGELLDGKRVLGAQNMIVCPNGIRTATWRRSATTEVERTVIVVGRLSEAKGQSIALEAAAHLADSSVKWMFVGDGEDRLALERQITRDSLWNVQLVGAVDDPRPYYETAMLCLIPSRWDACPYVLLEALAMETPVLVSPNVRTAGAFSAVTHRLENLDPAHIAARVAWLLKDQEQRTLLTDAGRREVEGNWDLDVRLGAVLQLYAEAGR